MDWSWLIFPCSYTYDIPRLQSFPSQQLTDLITGMVPPLSHPQGENPEFLTGQIDPKWCVST